MNVLAIVPARGGSKGVPGKNLKKLASKPLIAHTIETALASSRITDLVTSSDDDEILKVARSYGSDVVKRPNELALDETKMPPVVNHILEWKRGLGIEYDALILLQPTCPFRSVEDIDSALKLIDDGVANSVISVCEVGDHHPARMYRSNEERLTAFMPDWEHENRQNLPVLYQRNGLIYALRRSLFETEQTFFIAGSHPLISPIERAVNIDEPFDFILAELLLNRSNEDS